MVLLWDIEWIDDNGTPLEQQRHLTEETARLQAQRWLKSQPGSRVYLYRRRGETSVLVQVLTVVPHTCPDS